MSGFERSIISNQPCRTWRAQAPSAGEMGQGGASDRSCARSYPAEKHGPPPRMISTRTSGSRSPARKASKSSVRRRCESALRFSGRFNVRRRTCGRGSSIRTTGSVMTASFRHCSPSLNSTRRRQPSATRHGISVDAPSGSTCCTDHGLDDAGETLDRVEEGGGPVPVRVERGHQFEPEEQR